MKKIILLTFFIVLSAAITVNAGTISVKADGSGDYPTVQDAINDSNAGDVIILQPGTYTGPGNRDIDFLGKAITVRSTDPNDPNIVAATVIDCNATYRDDHRGFYFHSGEDANSILNGLTITNGLDGRGGGIYCSENSPTITNCIITSNEAGDGGGIYCDESNAVITNCTITENSAEWGGGICCDWDSNVTVNNCIINTNTASLGGGISCEEKSNATINNCTINANTADVGGGIYCEVYSNVTINNCTINTNTASFDGGGISCELHSDATINNSTITANTARNGGGGGIFFLYGFGSDRIINNCTITENSAEWGGGIFCVLSNLTVKNCTIVNNSAYEGGGICFRQELESVISNCILYYNQASQSPQIYLDLEEKSSLSIEYSNIQGSDAGQGNIDSDPCFVKLGNGYWHDNNTPDPWDDFWVGEKGDYHLLSSSPCIDTGDPNFIPEPNETDLDGQPRLLDGNEDGIAIVDMGAYEYRPPITADVSIEPDTLNLASKGNWLTCHIWLPEDYNVADIDPNSVFLEDTISANSLQINNNAAIVKFSRSEVQSILIIGENEITVTGELLDGTIFEGSDTIRVINSGGGKAKK